MNLQFFAEGADKTEEPTAKKLQDARKEGQVAKSQEIISGAMLFALFIVIKLFGGYMAQGFMKVFYRDILILPGGLGINGVFKNTILKTPVVNND
jgi:flagellar biosynthesis protein FlhB